MLKEKNIKNGKKLDLKIGEFIRLRTIFCEHGNGLNSMKGQEIS
jgi:hypothetical protein